MVRCLAVVVVSSVCLFAAAPALAQHAPSIGARPRITFGTPGANPFLDRTVTHTQARHPGSAPWQVVTVTPAPKGPRTNDCQMPVVVGDTSIDARLGRPVVHAPNPMAKVATPCPAIKK